MIVVVNILSIKLILNAMKDFEIWIISSSRYQLWYILGFTIRRWIKDYRHKPATFKILSDVEGSHMVLVITHSHDNLQLSF